MKMKSSKYLTMVVIILMLFPSVYVPVNAAGTNALNVEVDDVIIDFDVQPVIMNGRMIVPVRAIFEALDMAVKWDGKTRTVTAINDDYEIKLRIDDTIATVNGEEYILDEPATIIDKRTLVPVRFIGESIGASVVWEQITHTALIYTTGYIPSEFADDDVINGQIVAENYAQDGGSDEIISEEDAEDIEILREKISFIYDEKLFLVYAFMNYTGYVEDEEALAKGKISEVRLLLMEDLEAMDLELMNDRYYAEKEERYDDDCGDAFMGWYLNTTAYPEFDVPNKKDDNIEYYLQDLDDHLIEFYEEANIHELYLKYEPYYEEVLDMYRSDQNLLQMVQVLHFLGLEVEDVNPYGFQTNLLESWDTGLGLNIAKHIPDIEVITTGGNDDKANTHNFVHEYLHSIVNGIIDDDIGLNQFLRSELFEENEESDIYEIFVQAINVMQYEDDERRLSVVNHEAERYGDSMLYVYDKFYNEYPDYEGTLAEFIEEMLY